MSNIHRPILKSSFPLFQLYFILFDKVLTFLSVQKFNSKKRKERNKKEGKRNINRKQLGNMRVIQRNLVYITNIALSIAKEEVTSKHEFIITNVLE